MKPDAKSAAPDARASAPDARRVSIQLFLLYAAIWLVLIGHFPKSASFYPRIAHAEANALFRSFGSERSIEFSWIDPASTEDGSDTIMRGWVRGEESRRWQAVYSIRRRGYWPAAAIVAAVLATPMSFRRRAGSALGGALLLNVFLMAQLAVFGLCAFGASESAGPHPGWHRALAVATGLFNSPVPSYALVFALWALLVRPSAAIYLRRPAEGEARRSGRRGDDPGRT